MAENTIQRSPYDPSGFVLLSDYVPGIVQEIRYFSTYNFIGDRIDGYEEPCAILTVEAARALKATANKANVYGYRLKIFDAYRPACAVRHFVLWGIEEWALGWSPTRVTVSTCGLVPNMKRFLEESKCNLAISMHSPFHDERLKLMPVEKTYPIKEVIHAVRQHDWHGQRRLSFEYIVFKDLNASKDHVKEIARLLGSMRCRINLIRYHAVPNIPLKSPDAATMTWFRDALNDKGIIATIRASRGQDIDAACGLLSTKELNK